MPKEVFDKDYQYLPHSALLSFEEITRLARIFVAHGVHKIRLTGGEPLLRKNLEVLVEQLAALRTPDGEPLDLTLTTNGSLLARKAAGAEGRRPAARDREPRRPRRRGVPPHERRRLPGGRGAARASTRRTPPGLGPIKVNMVVKRGTNEQEILPMARHFRGTGIVLRFIEYMDVGATNGWRMDEVLPSAEVVARIARGIPAGAARASCAGRDRASAGRYARRRRRDRRDQQRDAGLLPRLQPRAPVDRRQALPVPVRQPAATTCARCCAAAPATRRSPPPSATSGRAAPTAIPNCAAAARARHGRGAPAPRRDELHRRMSARMPSPRARSPAWCSPAAAAPAWAASTRACRTSTACRWRCTRCCGCGRRSAR